MLDPNQSASITEPLLHHWGAERDCVCLVLPTVPRTPRYYSEVCILQITVIIFKQDRNYKLQNNYTADCQSPSHNFADDTWTKITPCEKGAKNNTAVTVITTHTIFSKREANLKKKS
jgi:hypothetical protein